MRDEGLVSRKGRSGRTGGNACSSSSSKAVSMCETLGKTRLKRRDEGRPSAWVADLLDLGRTSEGGWRETRGEAVGILAVVVVQVIFFLCALLWCGEVWRWFN